MKTTEQISAFWVGKQPRQKLLGETHVSKPFNNVILLLKYAPSHAQNPVLCSAHDIGSLTTTRFVSGFGYLIQMSCAPNRSIKRALWCILAPIGYLELPTNFHCHRIRVKARKVCTPADTHLVCVCSYSSQTAARFNIRALCKPQKARLPH